MAFKLTSSEWPGLAKLIEEAGEVIKESGKIVGGCETDERIARLEAEMGDLFAALHYVMQNNPQIVPSNVHKHMAEKLGRWSERMDAKKKRELNECGS